MGDCCSRTVHLTEEEQRIENAQVQLNFHKYDINYIDNELYRYGKFHFLTPESFARLCQKLKFPGQEAFSEFFNLFKGEFIAETEEAKQVASKLKDSKLFSVVKLDLLGIMLSKGSIKEKSKILLRNYDPNNDQQLSQSEIKDMVQDLLMISLDYLPLLAVLLAHSMKEKNSLRKYREKLIKMKDNMRDYFIKLLYLGEDLTIDVFTQRFDHPEIRRLLEASQLRTFVIKHFEEAEQFYAQNQERKVEGLEPPPKMKPKKREYRKRVRGKKGSRKRNNEESVLSDM